MPTKARVSVVRVTRPQASRVSPKEEEEVVSKEQTYTSPLFDQRHSQAPPSKHMDENEAKSHRGQNGKKEDLPEVRQSSILVQPKISQNIIHDDGYREKVQTAGSSPFSDTTAVQQQPPLIDSWMTRSQISEGRPYLTWKAPNKWGNGLCTFLDDFNIFCYACGCWCCFRHELSSMMNEHWLLWFVTCIPLMQLRTKFRQQYGIQGSIAEDCCLTTCCPLCVALQLANEGRDHGHRIFS